MKILTLNTHSLQEENYAEKLEGFIERILVEQPDVIAMQEVNQTIAALKAPPHMHRGLMQLSHGVPLREDNHAAVIAKRLHLAGIPVSWAWQPIKIGYGKYDEGLAILCPNHRIRHAEAFTISTVDDYTNWKTRKVIGVQMDDQDDWFYTVHMGWWNDSEEPFRHQWKAMRAALAQKGKTAPVWLMGDFNGPAEVRGESYDYITKAGWQDAYLLADEKDDGITVSGVIDGWRDKIADPQKCPGMRIDQIWCSHKTPVASSKVIFNGTNGPVVSDHYGVIVQTR